MWVLGLGEIFESFVQSWLTALDANSVMGAITCWVHPHPLKEEEGIVGDDGVSKKRRKIWKISKYYNLIIKNHELKLLKDTGFWPSPIILKDSLV